MKIIITQWALDSYLDLVKERAFSKEEYWNNIRPDVLLLANYPNEKFEKRKLAIFKTYAQLILQNRYKKCGVLI